jgi:hypothetical protein
MVWSFLMRSFSSSSACFSAGFVSMSVASTYTRRSGSSMFITTARSSSERPVASASALSMSSWMRRTCASTSIVRSYFSGSGVICARMVVPLRVTSSARARVTPSMMMFTPPAVFAICRMMPTVPIRRRSSGVGSSMSLSCSSMSTSRSLPKARLTDSIETGRFTASGCRVSGNPTVRRRGRTGNSEGRAGGVGSAIARFSGGRRRLPFFQSTSLSCHFPCWYAAPAVGFQPNSARCSRRLSHRRSGGDPCDLPTDFVGHCSSCSSVS